VPGDFVGRDSSLACARQGKQVLVGDLNSVHAALDAHAEGSGIDHDASYHAARDALGGDRLATLYINGKAYADALNRMLGAVTGTGTATPGLTDALAQLPPWQILGLRAEDDAIVLDVVSAEAPRASAGPSLLPLPSPHASRLLSQVPGDAIAYYEIEDAGTGARNLIATLRSQPAYATVFPTIDQALNLLGGEEQAIGWIGDAGAVAYADGTEVRGGVLLEAADSAAATSQMLRYKGLLQLGGGAAGVQLRSSTVDGLEVVTITLPESSGGGEISMAAHGRVLLIGTGEGFIKRLAEVTDASSLPRTAAFQHAMNRGYSPSAVTAYVSAAAGTPLVERLLTSDQLARWQSDIKPYVAPFEALLATSTTTGLPRARFVITVVQPPTTPQASGT
jgi:hypothetical protein